MKIYEIPAAIRMCFEEAYVDEETGEIFFDHETFDVVAGNAKDKIANCARFIREEEHEIEAMKAAMNAIKERMDTKKRKLEWLQRMTLTAVQALGQKVEMPDIRVGTRKSEQIIVADDATLDERFVTVKTTTTPDKKALKEAIKQGEEIEGVQLVTNYSLSIK